MERKTGVFAREIEVFDITESDFPDIRVSFTVVPEGNLGDLKVQTKATAEALVAIGLAVDNVNGFLPEARRLLGDEHGMRSD